MTTKNKFNIRIDSRAVEDGDVFYAQKRGEQFVADVLDKASQIFVEAGFFNRRNIRDSKIVEVSDLNTHLVQSLQKRYNNLPQHIIAITGTNGKTSTCWFMLQLLTMSGKNTLYIGTNGIYYSISGKIHQISDRNLTTPAIDNIYRTLHDIKEEFDINYAILEASSHGLLQGRLNGLSLCAVGFTNLTQDHLDYHKTMSDYMQAKLQIFNLCKPSSIASINSDIAQFSQIVDKCNDANITLLDYGNKAAHLKINKIERHSTHGQQVELSIQGNQMQFFTKIIGQFQIYNICCAMNILTSLGFAIHKVIALIEKLECIPGRMQNVGKSIFVDYAHTPDALQQSIETLYRIQGNKKLIVIFGCGGDRDTSKRPLMGAVAAKSANLVIITNDNPRTENAQMIRDQILAGVPVIHASKVTEIGSRKEAIEQTIKNHANDIILIAGKGHENYQIIGDKEVHFDDAEIAKQAIADL